MIDRTAFTLQSMLAALEPTNTPTPEGAGDVAIHSVCIDSRQAAPNSLFVALKGEHVDGHSFVQAAFAKGAAAALIDSSVEGVSVIDLVQRRVPQVVSSPVGVRVADALAGLQRLAAYKRSEQPDLKVIGVTGSVGKTTAKEVIAHTVAMRYPTHKSAGNHNNEIGLPLTLLELRPEHACAVLEMGMYDIGEIELLCGIARPDVGVVMNVEPVHLERLGTIERIAQAKAELVRALPSSGYAVLNGDDHRTAAMARITDATALSFGLDKRNSVWASDIVSRGLEGVTFTIHVEWPDGAPLGKRVVNTSMLGRHAVYPALAAAAVGIVLGLELDTIVPALEAVPDALRLVPRRMHGGVLILDDSYNASPIASMAALDLLSEIPGRHIAVLGDMLELGSAEEEGHRRVGQHCARTVDHLLVVGDRAATISRAATDSGMPKQQVRVLADNAAVIDMLRDILAPDDVVLVKGSRSMNMEEIVAALVTGEAAKVDSTQSGGGI